MSPSQRLRVGGFIAFFSLVLLLFAPALTKLVLYAYTAKGGLYSHILVIPFIAARLFYLEWALPSTADRGSILGAIVMGGIGIAALALGTSGYGGTNVTPLFWMTTALISLVAAGGFLFFGTKWMAATAFPFAFLIFMIPLPEPAVAWLEDVSAIASAEVAALFLKVTGLLQAHHGTGLDLPGISLVVAPECSGIRSTLVLFIVTLLAAQLFLKTRSHRLILVALVVPIGLLRNAFRIWFIGLLCVRLGPHMIDSAIHRKGGPLFFALSLIPMALLLWRLRSWENTHNPRGPGLLK